MLIFDFLSLVVDASPLGIAICDFDGNITETNRAWNAMQSETLSRAIESVADGESQTVRLADALIVRISKLWFVDSGFKRRFILVERLTDEIAAAEKQMFNKIVRTIGHEVNRRKHRRPPPIPASPHSPSPCQTVFDKVCKYRDNTVFPFFRIAYTLKLFKSLFKNKC